MRYRGFTVVELVIVITIIGILITLTSASLNNSIIGARDSERKTDIETIAVNLEKYYNSNGGTYPSTDLITNENIKNIFPDIDTKSLSAPGITNSSLTPAATKDTVSSLSKYSYIYQPFDESGELCKSVSSECRRFILYCFLESSNEIYSVESKNQ